MQKNWFFVLLLGTVFSDMVVFFGSFGGGASCDSHENLTWFECVNLCNTMDTCYFAFRTPFCNLCNYGQINNTQFTNKSTDREVALKTDPGSNCFKTIEMLQAGRIDPLKTCQKNYTKFVRKNYTLCVRFINESMIYTDAHKTCNSSGESLIGIESREEFQILAQYGVVWIAAYFDSALQKIFWTDRYLTPDISLNFSITFPELENSKLVVNGTSESLENVVKNCNDCPNAVACGKVIW